MTSLAQYLVNHIKPDGVDCWLWTGPVDVNGYGHVNVGSTTTTAHRAVFRGLVGDIPIGLELDHLCRVRHCVNPDHLQPVTHAENVQRRRIVFGEMCANGHRRYVRRGGRRICLWRADASRRQSRGKVR